MAGKVYKLLVEGDVFESGFDQDTSILIIEDFSGNASKVLEGQFMTQKEIVHIGFGDEAGKPHTAPTEEHREDIDGFDKTGSRVLNSLFPPVDLGLLARRRFVSNNDFWELLLFILSHPFLQQR